MAARDTDTSSFCGLKVTGGDFVEWLYMCEFLNMRLRLSPRPSAW
jgi:hypothetical protein